MQIQSGIRLFDSSEMSCLLWWHCEYSLNRNLSKCLIVSKVIWLQLVKCIRDYRRTRRHRLSSRALKKLPTHKFKKGDPYDCCAVCLEDYIDNDKLRILPCSHGQFFYLFFVYTVYGVNRNWLLIKRFGLDSWRERGFFVYECIFVIGRE